MNEREAVMEGDPIRFSRGFVQSEAFKALFQEGMALVEEAASYLDGPGREESRRLSRAVTLAYATESMRLTTRLMQIASWLLVQRGLAEGELGPDQALQERNRLRLANLSSTTDLADFDRLPSGLRDLVGLSARLHARILHLDLLLSEQDPPPRPERRSNPVAAQQALLQRVFGEPAET